MPWPASKTLLAPLAPWFETARRDLPWRAMDLDAPHPDPYAVLVSELMLQQTQVSTVVPYFLRWMEKWPTAASLATATEDDIHKAWEGLGYYRRARLLHAAAGCIARHGWPRGLDGLLEIPGLGPYTAAAVASQAFQLPEPALDGNAFRVLARLLGLEVPPKSAAAELRNWLRPALQDRGPSRMTQALMELGATVCGPAPRCESCPLASACGALAMGATARIPPATKRARPKESEFWLVALEFRHRWLLHQPSARGLLAGLWRWPAFPLDAARTDLAAEPEPGYGMVETAGWPAWTQVYTHRRERVNPLRMRLSDGFDAPARMSWVPLDELDALPMGRRDQKLRDLIGSEGEPIVQRPPLDSHLARFRRGEVPVL